MQMNVKMERNKLIETLGSLHYFDLSEQEALNLVLKNNKGICKIVLEEEYEESDSEETSHMVEMSSISLGYLQGAKFIVDNENQDVKRN